MSNEPVEERYLDVLQNLEFAIVSVYHERPDLADSNVDRVLEALVRRYNAEANNRPAPVVKVSDADQALFDRVEAMCEWRLGRSEDTENGPTDVVGTKTPDEIVLCLKRMRRSVKYWTKEGGRQGYLNFIDQYVK